MFQMTAIVPQTHLKPTFLKDHVYENCPQSIAELKVAITQKIRAIRQEECVRVTDNFSHDFKCVWGATVETFYVYHIQKFHTKRPCMFTVPDAHRAYM